MSLTELKITEDRFELHSGQYELTSLNKEASFVVKEDNEVYLYINLHDELDNLSFVLQANSTLVLNIVNVVASSNLKMYALVKKGASIKVNIADFSSGKSSFKCLVDLSEEQSSCYTHLATVSQHNDNKEFEINLNHLVSNTSGKVECYGVAKDKSKIIFSGASYIQNHAVKSNTSQIAKAMIFDKEAIAIAKPVLGIYENDVIASHSAAVGRINEDHLYYLTSRGLSVEEARKIITLGYLKPIINKFDESHQQEIETLIQRSL